MDNINVYIHKIYFIKCFYKYILFYYLILKLRISHRVTSRRVEHEAEYSITPIDRFSKRRDFLTDMFDFLLTAVFVQILQSRNRFIL